MTKDLESKIREILKSQNFWGEGHKIIVEGLVALFEAELKEERKWIIRIWENSVGFNFSDKDLERLMKKIDELKGEEVK